MPSSGQSHDIPWAKPTFWDKEEQYVLEALRSSWISGGPFVERFERGLADYLACKHVMAVSNGTAALHLAYIALGLKAGDEVVTPAFGFMAAANIALQLGMRPVFCDVDPDTWCMRADDIKAVLSPKTRAIVAVHSYGNVCEMESIIALGRERGIPVIEDAAEALGSLISGVPAGTLGTINTFSFHATKTITTGEGGLVATNDDALAATARLYRSHGLRRERHYWHEVPGHNFRMTNLQAALGCAQFEHVAAITRERRRVFSEYERRLNGMPGVVMQRKTPESDPLIWAVGVLLNPDVFPQGRDRVSLALAEKGIETRPGFQAPSEMTYFNEKPYPVADNLGRWVLSLPTFATLQNSEIEYICRQLSTLARA
ncbi:DegT/DnrJ/EryC1/StrS family aminotransferase [Bradyrhizobium sp. 200]|uniref:DegT/DnrJ/EryC1/StrS family aminotransferase n=1 Tax=Bradyrhizobium sp. 200 TaxID=2782665 RepID=UPI0020637459|nr:DegT/DnrJ/EryC1/StrS family aminotransferase [Bradyrhizobium sp. 200]UPJ51913.1 DegT/DnrJ/EryC1/StrS family aminotransferase [Bradyrhizobium sp. 200]